MCWRCRHWSGAIRQSLEAIECAVLILAGEKQFLSHRLGKIDRPCQILLPSAKSARPPTTCLAGNLVASGTLTLLADLIMSKRGGAANE